MAVSGFRSAIMVALAICAMSASVAPRGVEGALEDLVSVRNACAKLAQNNKAVVQGCALKNGDGSWAVKVSSPGDAHGAAGTDPACAASATFIDSAHTASNFGKLRVATTANHSDADQAYGAGLLEGYLTAARIYDHHYNLKRYFVEMLNVSETLEASLDWLEDQEAWAAARIASAPPSDPYWRLLGLVQAQFEGLVAGYQAAAREEAAAREGRRRRAAAARRLMGTEGQGVEAEGDVRVGWLSRRDLLFLNSNGDVYDLIDAQEAGWGLEEDEGQQAAGQQQQAEAEAEAGEEGAATADAVLRLRLQQRRRQRPASLSRRRVPRGADIDDDPMRESLRLGLQGKCSALIKVTGDLSDLLLGHSTHDSYTAMMRIYKHYDFSGLADPGVTAHRVSFSSYPGELFSDDDFYLLSSGLAILETTNHIYVGDVFRYLTRRCVLSWQRLRLAGWMAGSGEEWVRLFSRHNSGTYNNQYMVVDSKRFKPRQELKPGLLWVVEQLPGMIKSADMTEELSRGYWPSYNVAFFPEVYEAAGYPDMIARLEAAGERKNAFNVKLLRYQIAPRAQILRRDQGGVTGLDGLKRMMRYNDWRHDPVAEGNPTGAVCARGDLAPGGAAIAKGCFDSKVTNFRLMSQMESEVVGGPTAQGQPPFSWSDPRWAGLPHRGMPDTFDFAWERMSAAELPTSAECAAAAEAVVGEAEEEAGEREGMWQRGGGKGGAGVSMRQGRVADGQALS